MLRPPAIVSVVAASVVVAAGCGDSTGARPAPSGTTPPTASSTPAQTALVPRPNPAAGASEPSGPTSQAPEPSRPPEPITLALAGDVHFEAQLRSRLEDPATALAPIADELSAADLTVVNLETSIGSGGTRAPKRFTFQAPPRALTALSAAGVDVVSMANNHAVDFGLDGLAETLAAGERAATEDPPLSVVGVGRDVTSAFAPAIREVHGTTVAVLAASAADHDPSADPTGQWAATADRPGVAMALDPERLVHAVRAAQDRADVVVVYLHWGVQGERCPSNDQKGLARTLAEAGADVVVGSHAHRVQGAGLLDDTYVAYGLGNFVWYTSSGPSATTGVLTLGLEGGEVVREQWSPATVGRNGLPTFADGRSAGRPTADFDRLRDCAGLAPVP